MHPSWVRFVPGRLVYSWQGSRWLDKPKFIHPKRIAPKWCKKRTPGIRHPYEKQSLHRRNSDSHHAVLSWSQELSARIPKIHQIRSKIHTDQAELLPKICRSIGSKVFQFLWKTLCTPGISIFEYILQTMTTWHPNHVKVAPLQAALFCSKSTDLPGPWRFNLGEQNASIHPNSSLWAFPMQKITLNHVETDSPSIEAVLCVHPQPNW